MNIFESYIMGTEENNEVYYLVMGNLNLIMHVLTFL